MRGRLLRPRRRGAGMPYGLRRRRPPRATGGGADQARRAPAGRRRRRRPGCPPQVDPCHL